MSDFEDEKPHTSHTNNKHLKLRRISVEIEVTELVKTGKLQTKSDELKRQERFHADYEKELNNIDLKKESNESELENYSTLKSNMDLYFANELQIDTSIDTHRQLSAFLKEHVSIKIQLKNLEDIIKQFNRL